MNSDDEEMFAVLLEEENATSIEDVEHMQILASLARLYMQTAIPNIALYSYYAEICKKMDEFEPNLDENTLTWKLGLGTRVKNRPFLNRNLPPSDVI